MYSYVQLNDVLGLEAYYELNLYKYGDRGSEKGHSAFSRKEHQGWRMKFA